MNKDLTEQLKQIHTFDKASLLNLWQEVFERPAAGAPPREVMWFAATACLPESHVRTRFSGDVAIRAVDRRASARPALGSASDWEK